MYFILIFEQIFLRSFGIYLQRDMFLPSLVKNQLLYQAHQQYLSAQQIAQNRSIRILFSAIYTSFQRIFYHPQLNLLPFNRKLSISFSNYHLAPLCMQKTLSQKFHHILQHQKPVSSTLQQHLPMISLNQLESKVSLFKKKNRQKQNLTQQVANHQEINVCSPFYDRMKTHKQNCKCPYHRKQRLTLVPVRHTDKSSLFRGQQIQRNTVYQKGDISRHKHRNESYFFKKSSSHMRKQISEDPVPFSQTQPVNFNQKPSSHDYSYYKFMKDCNYFMLNKKGFVLGNSNHVVRKGVKEIFEFINKHLDYSVQKMCAWINSVEKDKDYGQFYVERFREMKINYEMNRHKHGNKTATASSFYHLLNRTHKINSKKPKLNYSNSNFSKLQPNRYKKSARRNLSSDQSYEQQSASSEHTSSDCDSNDSEVSLDKIISQLKLKHKLSEKTSEKIMKKGLDSFMQLFEDLQANIMNEKYPDELLQKFDSEFFQSIIKKYSNNKSIKHIQTKIQIITKTHQTLKNYQTIKKSTDRLNKTNPNETFSNSKGFIGSKRNTQIGENSKTSNSLHSNSKKYSSDCSLEDIKDPTDNINAIEEDDNQVDEDGIHGHKNQENVRRSKLLKGDEFDLKQIRASIATNSDCTDKDFQRERQNAHKGFFTKAQKFLFDIKMGKSIVKKEDSIFTMKRKVRVMKILLKENSNSTQSNQLKDYIHAIEHKIQVKTNQDKRKATQISSTELMSDEEIWRWISLDNLGFNLIFYNLTSKINAQENEDLCILLSEIKMNGIKKLENHVTYKDNFKSQQSIQQTNKKTKKTKIQDIFVQQGMGNMQFEPKIQSESSKDFKPTGRPAKKTKTRIQNFKDLASLLKNAQINGSHDFNFELEDMDDIEMQMNYQKIKKMLKYAKIHLPQTFEKYLKNSLIYNSSQMNSFIDS